jgi:hypothetical protein
MDEQRTQVEDRPIGDLVRQLSDQTTTLVRQEIELAKAEMTAKGKQPGARHLEHEGGRRMGEDPREDGEAVETEQRAPEEIEADIERTRREMGDTVAAVAEKADVKAQAKAKVEDAKARLKAAAPDSAGDGAGTLGRVASENRRPLIIGGAVLVAFLLGRAAAGRD